METETIEDNLPSLVRETLRKNEEVIAVYPTKGFYTKQGIFSTT